MITLRRCHQVRFAVCRVYRHITYAAREPQQRPVTDEYTETPEYPQILDISFKAKKKREAESWHDQVRQARTVEEKMIKINMPRFYGYKVVELGDSKFPYNCLPASQHYTRTLFEEKTIVTKTEKAENEAEEKPQTSQMDSFVGALRGDVQDSLEFSNDFFKHKYEGVDLDPVKREQTLAQLILEQVNRSLINKLAADFPHLHELDIDYNPRHEAFWFVGGIDPPKAIVRIKKGTNWQKEMANDPIDRHMQYIGEPYLALRHLRQLPAWESFGGKGNLDQLPVYKYDPHTLGYSTGHRHGTNIPGYWPSNTSGFGFISYQSRAHMNLRPASYGPEDFKEALHAQAIQSSYAWLLAQANYQGFNTFSDLTYPMNTQTIITNGRDWSFYEYQLNTLLVHSHHVNENPHVNYCRGTPEMQLFQEFDAAGRCIGFNEEVLRQLVQFYINVPSVERTPEELHPYLQDKSVQRIVDYENEDQRTFLNNTFKHISSNRPRHLAIPEIYLWEKIYKIDFKTRSMEAKRRYFELGINPWKRTLDQHQKVYIPRALRPEGTKSKNKWKKTYYP